MKIIIIIFLALILFSFEQITFGEIEKETIKLKKLLPTEEKLEEITHSTIWKYIDKQVSSNEELGITQSIQVLLRDVSRIYDPIINKYKIPTIQIEIIEYQDDKKLTVYLNSTKNINLEKIYENSYLQGSPTKNSKCMFNYFGEGAITICKTNEYVIQSTIFDKYQEHFGYDQKELQLKQEEITTRIVEEILKTIDKKNSIDNDYELYEILESTTRNNEKEGIGRENTGKQNKITDMEKDKKYGIQKFSCVKDEFGLITISGQFNNNEIKKDKITLEILFLDNDQNVIVKNTTNLLDIDEFETKRFLGNTKTDKTYSICTINGDS